MSVRALSAQQFGGRLFNVARDDRGWQPRVGHLEYIPEGAPQEDDDEWCATCSKRHGKSDS